MVSLLRWLVESRCRTSASRTTVPEPDVSVTRTLVFSCFGSCGVVLLSLLFLAALVSVTSCRSPDAPFDDEWTDLAPGLGYLERTTLKPLRVHAIRVDLCSEGIFARATAPGEGPLTVSAFGELVGAVVAVNGDFYGEGYVPLGLAVGDGQRWPRTRDRESHGLLAFGHERAFIPPPNQRLSEVSPDLAAVVGGRPAILHQGENVAPSRGGLCGRRHPRTAVGLSKDSRFLYIVVADGRSTQSSGLNCRELGDLMKRLGAYEALNLDGGGSSALWIRGRGVVNRPSEGSERPVANHLAIRHMADEPAGHCPVPATVATSDAVDSASH